MRAPDGLLAAAEVALNRYLALDAGAMAQCAGLDGRVLAVHLREFDLEFFLLPSAAGLQVLGHSAQPPDVRLSGSLPAFGRMLLQREGQAEILLGGAVGIDGDSELAQQFSGLLRRVHFDPEELLAGHLGGVAAHAIGNFARNAFGIGRNTVSTLGRDTAEYLREETRDLVHRSDVQKWMDEVDAFRSDVDRLEARLKRLLAASGMDKAS
jgi:ubiquinone biosynthesis protein UbiJ